MRLAMRLRLGINGTTMLTEGPRASKGSPRETCEGLDLGVVMWLPQGVFPLLFYLPFSSVRRLRTSGGNAAFDCAMQGTSRWRQYILGAVVLYLSTYRA